MGFLVKERHVYNSCRGRLENFPAGYFVLVLWVIMLLFRLDQDLIYIRVKHKFEQVKVLLSLPTVLHNFFVTDLNNAIYYVQIVDTSGRSHKMLDKILCLCVYCSSPFTIRVQ